MKASGTALYLFLCLCQVTPTCYVLLDKDVYGSTAIALFMGIFISFVPFFSQLYTSVGLESMTQIPAMLFLIPLMALLVICHITGGIKGVWGMVHINKK